MGLTADVLITLMVIAFFAVCVGYVAACDRIVGPETDVRVTVPEQADAEARS